MGLLDGIGRGISAAGYAAADMFSQKALAEQRAQLEEEKAIRIANAAETQRREGAQYDLDMKTNPENVRKAADATVLQEDIVGKAKTKREIEADIERGTNKGLLDAKRAEAKATRFDTTDYAGRKIVNEANQLKLDEAKQAAKIPAAVNATYDRLKSEANQITKAIYDAQAKDMLSPEGEQKLTDKLSNVTKQMNELMRPYMPKQEGAPKDKAAGGDAPPHPDGTRLRKGGQIYIVKGGMPVLESEASRTSVGKIK